MSGVNYVNYTVSVYIHDTRLYLLFLFCFVCLFSFMGRGLVNAPLNEVQMYIGHYLTRYEYDPMLTVSYCMRRIFCGTKLCSCITLRISADFIFAVVGQI